MIYILFSFLTYRILNSIQKVEEEEEEDDEQEIKRAKVLQVVILDMSCKYLHFYDTNN